MTEWLETALRYSRAFLVWWLGELVGLIPTSLWLSSPADRLGLTLYVTDNEIVLIQGKTRHAEVELLRVTKPNKKERSLNRIVDTFGIIAEPPYIDQPITLRFASTLGMRRLIELPLAAKDDLQQLLQFELDRLTPFSANDVYFSWRVEHEDSKARRMKIVVEIAPRASVDEVLGLAKAHGRTVDRVELEHPDPEAETLDLSPTDNRDRASWFKLGRRLKVAMSLALLLAMFLPFIRQMIIIDELEAQLSDARFQAEGSLALRDELSSLSEEASFLSKTRDAHPMMTETLAELTGLIPSDSHILQLTITAGTVDLSGYANKASDLLTILDESPTFESPRFEAPVTKDDGAHKEQFQIAVDIAKRRP